MKRYAFVRFNNLKAGVLLECEKSGNMNISKLYKELIMSYIMVGNEITFHERTTTISRK